MADEIHHPHDLMVRAVLSDVAEAAGFLQRHLPPEVSQALDWATLTLREGSFVDEDLRASEADFLYEVRHGSGEAAVWVYVLLEHQSTPDRWMRLQLLKYCCRIWGLSFRESPEQRELPAVVPLVFYQGSGAGRTPGSLPTCLRRPCGDGRGCPVSPTRWSINRACGRGRCKGH